MTQRLEAFMEGVHIGQFVKGDGPATFTYDADAPATPISLSLPREGNAALHAAGRFLDNLLPDHPHTRARMADSYGAGEDTFGLLAKAGGDVAGGLVLMPEGQAPPTGAPQLNPAADRNIAGRINSIKIDADSWIPEEGPTRFSLAGTQGKFALASIEDEWYWSNETVPSTHIIKPAAGKYPGLEHAEVAALTLAGRIGLPSTETRVLQVVDQTAFITERFDRAHTDDSVIVRRLHAEDLAQALGIDPERKYKASIGDIIRLLTQQAGHDVVNAFIAQLAFNTFIGNADAHAKNYSVLLRPGGLTMSPIYDAIPMGLYPEVDQDLAMPIWGEKYPQGIRPPHWRKFAVHVNLDPDEVVGIVQSVARNVAEHQGEAWDALEPRQAELLRTQVARNTDVALHEPGRALAQPAGNGPGRVGKGVPTGGQFTARQNSAPEIGLSPPD